MKKFVSAGSMLVVFLLSTAFGQPAKPLKILISVDMEGIAGVVASEECSRRAGDDYQYFRKIMTLEANAAVEGALAAGATDIIVRDAHGSGRNILPDLLHRNARLIRDWSFGPKEMMEGIDETFAAAVFVGYHARAGTPDAVLEHTWSGTITDVRINGVSLPESGINALVAGHFDVPVVFISGDRAACDQARRLLGDIEAVSVKQGIGAAVLSYHPEVACEMIKAGVEKAIRNREKYNPFKLAPPYTLVLTLKNEKMVNNAEFYHGARRTGDWELTFESSDLMEVMKAFSGMQKE